MTPRDTSVPVVVVRCARHGGLGINRSLGRLGVPVHNIDESRHAPAFHSRYSRGHFTWNAEAAAPQEAVRFLEQVAGKIGKRSILIPTSDRTALLVAECAGELEKWFDFPRVDPSLVRSFVNKREMFFLAKKHGVPTPECLFPQSPEELEDSLSRIRFPVMVKGIFGIDLQRKAGVRMRVIADRAQLLAFMSRFEDWGTPNIMIQEFIPGDADASWMFNGYFDAESRCLLSFTGYKIRQHPAYTGLTSLGQCVANDTVAHITCQFMHACRYRGILDMDYRFDARDGRYKAVDINPRVGATFRLFLSGNGMDVVRALYLDLTGQQVEMAPMKEGRKWLVEDCDLLSSIRYWRDGQLTLSSWLHQNGGIEELGIFATDDPLPAFWMGLRNVRSLLGISPYVPTRARE